jgi:uncharacterized protein
MPQGTNTDGSTAARRERGEAMTRIFLRPIATPLALGFLALSGATLVLSGLQLGWFAPQESMYVAIALLSFGFLLQLLASIFGFLSRDPVVATGMGILAASWLTIGLVKLNSAPSQTSHVLGVSLIFAGAALLIPTTGAVFGKIVPALVLLTAALRFFLTGLYQLTANAGVEHAAGIIGLILLGLAFYAALALEVEDVRRKTVLPVLRLGAGKKSVEGNMEDQLTWIAHEAGVREQL